MSPWNSQTTPDDVRSVLNCARVIARILPLIWEDDVDSHWLWEESDVATIASTTNDSATVLENDNQPQFVIDDENEESEAQSPTPSRSRRLPEAISIKPKPKSLMVNFLDVLIDSLFHVGFTLPLDATESAIDRTSYLIW